MNKVTLDSVMDKIHRLPSLPAVVNELILALGNEGLSVDQLAHGIEKDQALSARALRVANSPFYGMPQPVSSIHDAIVVLGFRAVGSLVTTAALTEFFTAPTLAWFDQSSFWRHSLGCGVCCRKLAGPAGLDPETGFTAGLLHDIGRLLLVVTCSKEYEAVVAWREAHDGFLVDAELAVLGVSHMDAGEALARHWHFAPEIQVAVAAHHQPPADAAGRYAGLTHLAEVLAHGLDLARDPYALASPLDAGVLECLDLDWPRIAAALPAIEKEFASYETLIPGAR
ncbi:HDOD domain-containing protein [Parasulfuritortus cantonensis]|uniref:HDOD domain-containing protein n=1 Tax=Parasulfuritortus cantonensis TaxID=2528202 RepID=A0A4R1BL57_9PROT|nr:HDOD domain-containing protein [Parasulfuritortus cantonensis]TCJ18037.1 HDOD domain-containing protein [Parasulfuritortus cantonensis]